VPLVDHCHNVLLALESVQIPENALVPLVYQDTFLLGSYRAQESHQEVDPAAIHGLRECLAPSHVKGVHEIVVLRGPAASDVNSFPQTAPEVGVGV
jgi:hypothetical protein